MLCNSKFRDLSLLATMPCLRWSCLSLGEISTLISCPAAPAFTPSILLKFSPGIFQLYLTFASFWALGSWATINLDKLFCWMNWLMPDIEWSVFMTSLIELWSCWSPIRRALGELPLFSAFKSTIAGCRAVTRSSSSGFSFKISISFPTSYSVRGWKPSLS